VRHQRVCMLTRYVTITKTVLTTVMKLTAVRQQLSTLSDTWHTVQYMYGTYHVAHHWLSDDE